MLSVSSPTCDSIVVSWKAVYMASGFSVSLMRSDGLGRMLKENTTNTSLTFTNLDPGTLYTIKAYAWNANGIPGDDFTSNQRTSKTFSSLKTSIKTKRYSRHYSCVWVIILSISKTHWVNFQIIQILPTSKFLKAEVTYVC